MAIRLFISLLAVALTLAASSCRRGPATTPVYDDRTHELIRIDYDYDRDGRIDVRTYMKNGRVARLEGDADGDGHVDRWEYYAADGHLQKVGGSTRHDGVEDSWAYQTGDDLRLDISTRRDGVVDRREFYHLNALTRTESDTNHDGLMDTWEQYENGRLAVLLVDDGKTLGRPTRRLTYRADGAVTVDVDRNGSGEFSALPGGAGAGTEGARVSR